MSNFSDSQTTETVTATKVAVLVIMFNLMVAGIGQSFIFTSLPPIGREVGLSDIQISFIIAFGACLFVVFSFIWGRLINTVGLRRTIQFGTIVYGLTTILLGVVLTFALNDDISVETTWYLSMLLRGIFTSGSAGVFPASQAYFVATSSLQNRTSSIANLGIAYSLGMIIGPAMAALLGAFRLTLPFFFIPVLCLISLVFLQLYMPSMRSPKRREKEDVMRWRGHPVRYFFLLSFLVIFCLSGVQQITLFYIQDILALTAQQATRSGGLAMTGMSVSMIIVQLLGVKRLAWSAATMIYVGTGLLFCGIVVLLIMSDWTGVLAGLGFVGAGVGFLFPAILASQTFQAKSHEQSHVAGANAAVQGAGMVVGPLTCATLYQQVSPHFPFIVIGFVSCIIGVYFLILQRSYMPKD